MYSRKVNYDLEDRTLCFAKDIVLLCKKLPKNVVNFKLIDQLIRAGGSIGANYREANDSLGRKNFIHRVRISRKECKETIFWLELIIVANREVEKEVMELISEASELKYILSSIIKKMIEKELA